MAKTQQQLELEHKYSVVAAAGNAEDFIALLECLNTSVSDIRTKIESQDSLELRQAMSDFLTNSIDKIRRIRKNDNTNTHETSETDDMN